MLKNTAKVLLSIFMFVGIMSVQHPVSFAHEEDMMANMNMGSVRSSMFMIGSITVTKDHKPVSDATVMAFDQGKSTDIQGRAEFEHVMPGQQKITVLKDNKSYTLQTTVTGPDTNISLDGVAPASNTHTTAHVESVKAISLTSINTIGFILIAMCALVMLGFLLTLRHSLSYVIPKKITNIFFNKHLQIAMLALLVTGIITSIGTANFLLNEKVASPSSAATLASIPTPQNVTVEQDDRVATISWGDPHDLYGVYNPDPSLGVYGYMIQWGPEDAYTQTGQFTDKKLTEYRVIQLQPLTNSTKYVAQISAVDKNGNLSNPTALVHFTGDSSRVDALRSKMNGFFDDFNLSAGAFDEKKWNFAVSKCVTEKEGGQFVNTQFHAHNQIFGGNCDRGQNVSRPRQLLDLSDNGTRTIVFDMDGEHRREQWYLDLLPYSTDLRDRPRDVSAFVGLETVCKDEYDAQQCFNPPNGESPSPGGDTPFVLRFHQTGDTVSVFMFDKDGIERATSDTANVSICKDFQNCPSKNLVAIQNVRRHWVIKLTKNRAIVTVDGDVVADANLVTKWTPSGLTSNQYSVQWNHFSYNTPKSNERSALLHWDNFGFDAPANTQKTLETHNYVSDVIGTKKTNSYDVPYSSPSSPASYTVKIPDSITDKTGQNPVQIRLHFTLQQEDSSLVYTWGSQANNKITINGKSYDFAQPTTRATVIYSEWPASQYVPFSTYIVVNPSDLKIGDNTVSFALNNVGVFNVHVEMDYPTTNAPNYTPPSAIWSDYTSKIVPVLPDIMPGAGITTIGGNDIFGDVSVDADPTTDDAKSFTYGKTLSGSKTIGFTIQNEVAETATGKNPGISKYDVLVDRTIVASKNTNTSTAVPILDDTYTLDTTKLCNGKHELLVRGYNTNGTVSFEDYVNFKGDLYDMNYRPFYITVNNAGGTTCSGNYIPTVTPNPYPNGTSPTPTLSLPSVSPLPTPMISPTVQPVPVTATPTIKPTVIPTVLPTPTPTKIITPTPKPTSTPTPVPTNTPIPTSSTGSTITVYAAGTQANQVYPTMRLLINNTVVQTWKGIKGDAANGVYQAFSYQTSGTILPKQIKVQFTNDLYVGSGNDRNLRVDKITINGVDYQTEASTVKSTGSWDPTNGCSIGNKQSEWLQCNGYFQYQ